MKVNVCEMIRAANAYDPMEACGVILHDGSVLQITNVASRPGIFIMDADELVAVYERHGDIAGVWHTHPQGSPIPSEEDLDAHPYGKLMFIATKTAVINYGRVGRPSPIDGIPQSRAAI